MYLLLMAAETVSLLFLGRSTGSAASEVSGMGLGNLVYNCAALAIGFGFTSSQDTLVTQAFGRGDVDLAKLYLHRCQIWMFGVCALSMLAVACTEPFLLALKVTDADTAHHAGVYTRLCILGLPGYFQYSALRKFLMAQKYAKVSFAVQCISFPVHVLLCSVLVPQYKVRGVGLAMAIKGWVDFSLIATYASCFGPQTCRGWWRCWTALSTDRAWAGMMDYLWLALPCVLMLVVEWWSFEMLGIMAGYLHDPQELAAHVAATNIASILYLAGTGASKAASTLVGAAIGRGAEAEVRSFVRAALFWNVICCVSMGLVVVLLRRPLVVAYFPSALAVQDILVVLCPILALQGLLDGLSQCIQGALIGFGLQNKASKVSVFCYWVIMLPASWALAFPTGLRIKGLWYGCIFSSCVALALNSRLLLRSDFSSIASAAKARMDLDSASAARNVPLTGAATSNAPECSA